MTRQKETTQSWTAATGNLALKMPRAVVRMVPWKMPEGRRLRPWTLAVLLAVAAGAVVLVLVLRPGFSKAAGGGATYSVTRGDLTISITENGSIKSRKSVDLKSDVEGQATIISIVPEGTFISAADVKKGKILVELESSGLKERYTQQKITATAAQAAYADAEEAYEIQVNQNNSDIKAGEIKLKFALMDLQKQLGEKVASRLIDTGKKTTTQIALNIPALVKDPDLGGAALQKLRELRSKIELAGEEHTRASTKLVWTNKLFAKKYVSEDDVKADSLAVKSKSIDLAQAQTNLDLYLLYDFPKDTEKLYSDYCEAQRELSRIVSRARSTLAQADAKRKSMADSFKLQKDLLDKAKKQLEACTLRAPSPGLVVYGSSMDFWARQSNPIQAGASVYQRQTIISIPDNREMIVEFKVHETWVNKVKMGLPADITVDAFPDETLVGRVTKVAPLADPQNWFNPDLKVFTTEVDIDGTHSFLKTGMSAKVKVLLQRVNRVLYVPVQSVVTQNRRKVCYLAGAFGTAPREVQTGVSNDNFVEITAGLAVGEKVLLNPPRPVESASPEKKERKPEVPVATTQPVATMPATTRPATQPTAQAAPPTTRPVTVGKK